MKQPETNQKYYYFIDVDLHSRHIIGWGSEPRGEFEVSLTDGFHRTFLSKGQYNKLIRELVKD
ncbi:MAG: hypothetical protein CME32_26690 [Gimesia sp.]|nr:hypothetical protein [Gimesia sp.]